MSRRGRLLIVDPYHLSAAYVTTNTLPHSDLMDGRKGLFFQGDVSESGPQTDSGSRF